MYKVAIHAMYQKSRTNFKIYYKCLNECVPVAKYLQKYVLSIVTTLSFIVEPIFTTKMSP